MTDSLIDDLNGTVCSAGACFEVADTIAQLRLRPPAIVGLNPGEDVITLAVPVCIEHAHLLRMGADLVGLDEGL